MPAAKSLPVKLTESERADFWSRVATRPGMRECWEWTSTRQEADEGYGRLMLRKRYVLAHRVAYVIAYGVDPGRRLVLHACDNPICVNPRHLRLGTHDDNVADEVANAIMAEVHAASIGVPTRRQRRAFVRWELKRAVEKSDALPRRRGRPGFIADEQAQAIRFTFWNMGRNAADTARAHACDFGAVRRIVMRQGYAHLPSVEGEPDAAREQVVNIRVPANVATPRWRSRGRADRASAAHNSNVDPRTSCVTSNDDTSRSQSFARVAS